MTHMSITEKNGAPETGSVKQAATANTETSINKTTNQAMSEADRNVYWYLSEVQYQEYVSKAYKVNEPRVRALSLLNGMSDRTIDYKKSKELFNESTQGGGLKRRSTEEVKAMSTKQREVYYALRDGEEYKLFNPNNEDLPAHVRSLILKKVEADGWTRYFIPTKEQMDTIDGIILDNVQVPDLIDKACRTPRLRETLKAHEAENSARAYSSKIDGTQPAVPSCVGVSLGKGYFCLPISWVRKLVYRVCFDPGYNTEDDLKLDSDTLFRLDRLILSRCRCDLQSKVPVRYDLLKETGMGTPFRVGLDNEFMLRVILFKGIEKQENVAFTTSIRLTIGDKTLELSLKNVLDEKRKHPRLCNSIACLPLYARYHALEHVYHMPMLEVYFPMGDLQLLVRAAKCTKLLTAMLKELKGKPDAEEAKLTDTMKDLFDCARDLSQGKEVCGDRLKKLVTELTGSEDEANRLLEACKSVKPYDCLDFVHVTSEFCKNHRTCIYAHDRVYVPADDKEALEALKQTLNAQCLIWALKGRSGSLVREFSADYDSFDTVRVAEEQAAVANAASPTSSFWTSWKDLLEAC